MRRVLLLLALVVGLHLLVGGGALSPAEVVDVLRGNGDPADEVILWTLRVPRVVVVLAAGALLSVAGWLLQDALGNPLAAPEITGVGPGAVLGVVLALTLGWVDPSAVLGPASAALVGGAAGGGAAWVLAGRHRQDPLWLAVAGLAVGAVASAVVAVCLALDAERLGGISRWLVGSADGRVAVHAQLLVAVAVVGVAGAWLLSGMLRVLSVGDGPAAALGLPVARVRAAALGLALLLASAAVAVVGMVAFIGLAVPHLVRRLSGPDPRTGLPLSAVLGAAVLTGADLLAQAGTWLLDRGDGAAVGVPLGTVTAVAGVVAVLARVRRLDADA